MASFLDVTGLAGFSKLFVFILVLVVVYGLLAYSKIIGDNKMIAWIIAFVLAIFVVITPLAAGAIAYISPWFVIIFIFAGFLMAAMKMFGASASDISSYTPIKHVFLVVVLLVLLIGFLSYFRERTTLPGDNETSTDISEYTKSSIVVFHPTILGAIVVLLIAVFTIALLSGKIS
jgi:hypothetical protein